MSSLIHKHQLESVQCGMLGKACTSILRAFKWAYGLAEKNGCGRSQNCSSAKKKKSKQNAQGGSDVRKRSVHGPLKREYITCLDGLEKQKPILTSPTAIAFPFFPSSDSCLSTLGLLNSPTSFPREVFRPSDRSTLLHSLSILPMGQHGPPIRR